MELDAEQSRSLASIWRTDWWWSTVGGRSGGRQVGLGGLGTIGSCKSSTSGPRRSGKMNATQALSHLFSWSLLRIHESMAVIGLDFVGRHKAPVQMSLTCCLLPLWSSYEFCRWGEGHHARLLLESALSSGTPLHYVTAGFLLRDHVYNWSG